MKKIFSQQGQNYYLGLDIGTDSVGWAVTDLNYKLLRVNNKTYGECAYSTKRSKQAREDYNANRADVLRTS